MTCPRLGGPRCTLGGREMGSLAQHGVTPNAELAGERVEPHGVVFIQSGKSFAAVAINPAHVTMALPRDSNEIAQEILFRFGEVHGRIPSDNGDMSRFETR